jgi:hypothetical protein
MLDVLPNLSLRLQVDAFFLDGQDSLAMISPGMSLIGGRNVLPHSIARWNKRRSDARPARSSRVRLDRNADANRKDRFIVAFSIGLYSFGTLAGRMSGPTFAKC